MLVLNKYTCLLLHNNNKFIITILISGIIVKNKFIGIFQGESLK